MRSGRANSVQQSALALCAELVQHNTITQLQSMEMDFQGDFKHVSSCLVLLDRTLLHLRPLGSLIGKKKQKIKKTALWVMVYNTGLQYTAVPKDLFNGFCHVFKGRFNFSPVAMFQTNE